MANITKHYYVSSDGLQALIDKIAELKKYTDQTIADSVSQGQESVGEQIAQHETRLDNAEARLDNVEDAVAAIHVPEKVSELENDADYQTGAQVNAAIEAVVDAAPEALDTLKEISNALNNDPDFAATMTNKLAEINNKDTEQDSRLSNIETALDDYQTSNDAEITELKTSYDSLKADYDSLKADYEIVKQEFADYQTATDSRLDELTLAINNLIDKSSVDEMFQKVFE